MLEDRLALVQGDSLEVLKTFAAGTVRCCVTSPPYWQKRDYDAPGQLGLEKTPEEFVQRLVDVFREVKRVLTDDGTLWVNLGDSYAVTSTYDSSSSMHAEAGWKNAGFRPNAGIPAGIKAKDLIGVPWMLAFALRADGWYLRDDIIWHKTNPLPESMEDRPTRAHEYLFLLSKSPTYFFDVEAIKEPAEVGGRGSSFKTGKTEHQQFGNGRKRLGARRDGGVMQGRKNEGSADARVVGFQDRWDAKVAEGQVEMRRKRDVWSIAVAKYKGAHFAVMPEKLVEPCVLAGSEPGDIILDPFCGSGTVGVVALQHGRNFVGIDLNPEYLTLANARIQSAQEKVA